MEQYTLPNWVFKRDGRLVPFEADKISQALFGATEAQGRPNAFLSRELTDGVLHFLAQETEGKNPTTDQIAELAAKVTRELGHPELARAFEEARDQGKPAPPESAGMPLSRRLGSGAESSAQAALEARLAFARQTLFTRDLVSALEDGLLEARGLEHAEAVDRLVVEPRTVGRAFGESLLEEMVRLRGEVGRTFVLDSPDHLLATEDARAWIRQLCRLLEALDRWAILNLNVDGAPAWSREGSVGPLFAKGMAPVRAGVGASVAPEVVARELIEELESEPPGHERILVDWHLREASLAGGSLGTTVLRVGRIPHWRWSLDRPGRAVSLGEGVDRDNPCVLMEIGLNLPRFFQMEGIEGRVDSLLEKVPSLANMAISAGVQKRTFLARMHSAAPSRMTHLSQGFLLYRARVSIVPSGLEEVVRQSLGSSGAESKAGLELEQRIVKAIQASAAHHGRARSMEVVVEQGLGQVGSSGLKESGSYEETRWLSHLKQAWKRPEVQRVAWVKSPLPG